MRSVIAKRLTESKQTSPHGHATGSADISSLLRLRKFLASRGIKVSLNDFVVKAVATALKEVPEMNLNVQGDEYKVKLSDVKILRSSPTQFNLLKQMMPNIDISVAVATKTGLITPIVKDVPSKSIQQVAAEVRDLAARAREGKLQLHEFQVGKRREDFFSSFLARN